MTCFKCGEEINVRQELYRIIDEGYATHPFRDYAREIWPHNVQINAFTQETKRNEHISHMNMIIDCIMELDAKLSICSDCWRAEEKETIGEYDE